MSQIHQFDRLTTISDTLQLNVGNFEDKQKMTLVQMIHYLYNNIDSLLALVHSDDSMRTICDDLATIFLTYLTGNHLSTQYHIHQSPLIITCQLVDSHISFKKTANWWTALSHNQKKKKPTESPPQTLYIRKMRF